MLNMNKISVIGNFGNGEEQFGGQTVKTRIVTDEIIKIFGNENVCIYNTAGGLKTLFKSTFIAFKAMRKSRNVVILPAHNGIRVFVPLLVIFQFFFRNRRVHYVAIGGWLPDFIKDKWLLRRSLHKLFMIYAETHRMERALIDTGYKNVTYMPNFKPLEIVPESSLDKKFSEPYALCTFSRVCSIKGISDAADAVMYVNSKSGHSVFSLDIYGKVEEDEDDWFKSLMGRVSSEVRYRGIAPFDKSVQVLKDYAFMLFPTRYHGEGIPGTIIDAYAAGLPVVSSLYPNFSEIIDEGVTGFGYEFGNVEALKSLLLRIAMNPKMILSLKKNCVRQAAKYQPDTVIKILTFNF